MEHFSLIENKLIRKIDREGVYPKQKSPYKNTFKTLVKVDPAFGSSGSNTLYGKRYLFNIPKQYDNLSQIYFRVTLSTGNVASTVEDYLATRLFKRITIRTKKGTTLQTITPEYTHMRLDQLINTPLYSKISNGVEPDVTFLAGDPVLIVPIFAFFSEDDFTFMKTRQLEPLEVECITANSKEDLGMSVDITSFTPVMYCLYHDTDKADKFNNEPTDKFSNIKGDYLLKMPNYLVGSYDTFYEDTVVCSSGTTSKSTVLLISPHPNFSINFALIASDQTRSQIKNIKLEVGGKVFYDFDYRMNYQMYGNEMGFVPNGTTSIFLNINKDRCTDNGLIPFNRSMYPIYATVEFDSLASDHTLHIFEEYRTNFKIDPRGNIMLSDDQDIEDQIEASLEITSSSNTNNTFT